MVDQGKEAGLRARETRASTASDHLSHNQDSTAEQPGHQPLPAAGRPVPRGGLSEQTRNRLATQLREMYDNVTQQPVPDRFAELIAKLDSADHGKV
ncbi:NepR family anti-sigma factor [Methylobacterium phyllostachyos]|uniref:NepR family anti-sigma factor n=1 Tax=Methylobacterium phyllostachyos TaxID=582672 RepID=UPI000B87B00D|nr:NepR family anti-sigma factor [Methylobacterium phyllostachyos]